MYAELKSRNWSFGKYLWLWLWSWTSRYKWPRNFNLRNFWMQDSRSFHTREGHVIGDSLRVETLAKVAFTHLLCCRGTIIHKHHRGEDIDQQSNYSQSVWCDPCRNLLDEPVPVDLTRWLKQGPTRGAVFMLLQPLELSGWQRLRPQEMWHCFSA